MLNFLLAVPNLFAEPMVPLALAVAGIIIALSYMAGEFFSMPPLKAFGKGEARELGVTAVIIIISMILLTPGGPFDRIAAGFGAPGGSAKLCPEWVAAHPNTGDYAYEGSTYAIGQAGYFLGCRWGAVDIMETAAVGAINLPVVRNLAEVFFTLPSAPETGVLAPRLISAYWELMKLEIYTGMASTFALNISIPQPLLLDMISVDVSNITPLAILAPINEANTALVDIVGTLVSAVAAQKMLLEFFEVNVPALMLPLGIAARAFPFTRKTGSTIIAFCFAVYFVFPASVLLNQRIYEMVQGPACEGGKLETGETCTQPSDCCSGVCRGRKCIAPITDFSEYRSLYAVCQDNTLKAKAAEINHALEQAGLDAETVLAEEKAAAQSSAEAGKTEDRYNAAIAQRKKIEAAREKMMEKYKDNVFMSLEDGFTLVGTFENMTSDVAGLMVLVSLFVVNEIIFTLTLFKDFSLLIGGEAKLFGLSKIV